MNQPEELNPSRIYFRRPGVLSKPNRTRCFCSPEDARAIAPGNTRSQRSATSSAIEKTRGFG